MRAVSNEGTIAWLTLCLPDVKLTLWPAPFLWMRYTNLKDTLRGGRLRLPQVSSWTSIHIHIRNHPFSTYVKFSGKLTFLTRWSAVFRSNLRTYGLGGWSLNWFTEKRCGLENIVVVLEFVWNSLKFFH